MFKVLYPYEYVQSVFFIDYAKLYNKGYRGIIFDIDNTLVHHGDNSTKEIDELFLEIQKIGFKTIILSNNNEKRVKRFLKNIDSLYICDAEKPKVDGYLKAIEMLNIKKEEAVFIGDQIFTDILGANRSGISNILVKYIRLNENAKIGKRRRLENFILKFYKKSKKFQHRLGDISKLEVKEKMKLNKKRNFCDINPFFYAISLKKEILKRNIKDFFKREKFAKTVEEKRLPNIVYNYNSNIIKRGKGIDIQLQENKEVNIKLACSKINGIVIHPGEVFSFWKIVGKTNEKNGYKRGRVIKNNKLVSGTGGGLCNLANTINLLILHSPLEITELHKHSDALAPDEGKRIPFSSGTSVSYNYIDYRFKNNSEQDVQILVWCEDGKLYGELRCEREFPLRYEIIEEDHHFQKEGEKYYRNSKIYRNIIDKSTDNILEKELIWDNHSKVMFDYDLIPKEYIKI